MYDEFVVEKELKPDMGVTPRSDWPPWLQKKKKTSRKTKRSCWQIVHRTADWIRIHLSMGEL